MKCVVDDHCLHYYKLIFAGFCDLGPSCTKTQYPRCHFGCRNKMAIVQQPGTSFMQYYIKVHGPAAGCVRQL